MVLLGRIELPAQPPNPLKNLKSFFATVALVIVERNSQHKGVSFTHAVVCRC